MYLFFFFNYVFSVWLLRVFVAGHGLPLVCGLLVAAALIVEQGLSGCGAEAAQLLRSTWDLLGPETEPSAPALAGGFSTPGAPQQSLLCTFLHRKTI